MKIAINGFGRIGRLAARMLVGKSGVELVAVNDLAENQVLAHLFKYDSAHGVFGGDVSATGDSIRINGQNITALTERDPEKLPWKQLGVDVVLECTGIFRSRKQVEGHLQTGASRVLISAPAKGNDVKTIVLGVNDDDIEADDQVISNASCTTNCLAPLVKLIDQNYGLRFGSMTTIHAYTMDQNLQDAPHSDFRRARAAAVNLIPTSTGAAEAVAKVYPGVEGKLAAMAMRVPIITGSVVELNAVVEDVPGADAVNALFEHASSHAMSGILQYVTDPIVSSDIVGNPYSSIFDSLLTSVTGEMIKVVSWYDNEAGYAARLADLTELLGKTSS